MMYVSVKISCPKETVFFFIDDFLANGNAAKGIIDLVEKPEPNCPEWDSSSKKHSNMAEIICVMQVSA